MSPQAYHRHGDTWKGGKSPLYRAWDNMRQRCRLKPENPAYDSYKHVRCCHAWAFYIAFRKWALAHGYEPGLYLDRRNNARGYSPANCRWVTSKVSVENRRWTAKRKAQMAVLNAKKRVPVVCLDTGRQFDSVTAAARKLGCERGNIARAIQSDGRTGGFRWAYGRAND